MAVATLTPLPPAEAIAALQRRGGRLEPTFSWQDAWQEEHARMFTVAKSAGFDILRDIHDGLVSALAEGKTIQEFTRELRPTLEAKGWWGRKEVTDPETGEISERVLGSTRRLRTIFETNMRVSYAAGHWSHFERNRAARPVLRYVAILDGRVRPAHRARHNLALPFDDPYWDTWGPPCGWGCRCTFQSLSLRDVERLRPQLKFTPPAETLRPFTNRRTGEVIRVPDGIDPGWGYNPGKAAWRASVVSEKLRSAPPVLAAAAVAEPSWPAKALADEFAPWFDKAAAGERMERSLWTIGAIDRPTLDALAQRDVELHSGDISIAMQTVAHLGRDQKTGRLAAVPPELLRRMPETISTAKAVLLDRRDQALLYVFDVPGEARLGKLVIRVNFTVRTRGPGGVKAPVTTNAVRSAGLVDVVELANPTFYEVITGSL